MNVWSEAKNDRRCDLIDRKYGSDLSDAEAKELEALQAELVAYRQLVAPLPLPDISTPAPCPHSCPNRPAPASPPARK